MRRGGLAVGNCHQHDKHHGCAEQEQREIADPVMIVTRFAVEVFACV